MTENVKKLLEILSEDEAFAEKAGSAHSIEKVIDLAKEKGIELTEEDVREATRERGSIDSAEMEQIAGGGYCGCIWGGFGKNSDKNDGRCVCAIAGYGNSRPEGYPRCICAQTGGGISAD